MGPDRKYLREILNSLTEHLVVIDDQGAIKLVNRAWEEFGATNGCANPGNWIGTNYLDICDAAAEMGDKDARKAATGIRSLIKGKVGDFYLEYPCHDDKQERWFMMRAVPLAFSQPLHFVITHQDITARKKAEAKALRMALRDGLTGLSNRRHFNECMDSESRRAIRNGFALSLILVDVDNFKTVNDEYGHPAGDACLVAISEIIARYAKRPGDLAARLGGDELALLLSGCEIGNARKMADRILDEIRGLEVSVSDGEKKVKPLVSIGVASGLIAEKKDAESMISAADSAMYDSKRTGGNAVSVAGWRPQARQAGMGT